MGNRISISFKNNLDESVVLFSHWDGYDLVKDAKRHLGGIKQSYSTPLSRLEPETIMVDFIRELTKGLDSVDSNYYLGKDEMDGDNSDNGHFTIDVNE